MNAIERAIRSAFQKGDAEDRAFRERVYRSALAALMRSMEASPQLSPEDVARRRALFKKTVTDIEQEFVPALAPEPVETSDAAGMPGPGEAVPSVDPAARSRPPEVNAAPELDVAPVRRSGMSEGEPVPGGGFPLDPPRRAHAVRVKRRRPVARLLFPVAALIVLALGGWWALQGLSGSRSGSVPSPSEQTQEDRQSDPLLPGSGAADHDWITVFSPADLTRVNAPAGMVAEALEEDGEPVLRIRSTGQGGTVALQIGQGALERAAGRAVMIAISARAQDDEETQISVTCDFGALGDCGRRRYLVGQQRSDFLFELDLPAARPEGPGRILINPDVVEGTRALDLFEVRMSVSR